MCCVNGVKKPHIENENELEYSVEHTQLSHHRFSTLF